MSCNRFLPNAVRGMAAATSPNLPQQYSLSYCKKSVLAVLLEEWTARWRGLTTGGGGAGFNQISAETINTVYVQKSILWYCVIEMTARKRHVMTKQYLLCDLQLCTGEREETLNHILLQFMTPNQTSEMLKSMVNRFSHKYKSWVAHNVCFQLTSGHWRHSIVCCQEEPK